MAIAEGRGRHHPNQYGDFAVADLEAFHRRAIEVGCEIVDGGIQTMPWGERMFRARERKGSLRGPLNREAMPYTIRRYALTCVKRFADGDKGWIRDPMEYSR